MESPPFFLLLTVRVHVAYLAQTVQLTNNRNTVCYMYRVSKRFSIMIKKYFISCIDDEKQVGAMQFEADENEYQQIAEKKCPQRAIFRAYEISEFEPDMPVNQFVSSSKMKDIGY